MWQPSTTLSTQPGGRVPAVGECEAFTLLLPPLCTYPGAEGAWVALCLASAEVSGHAAGVHKAEPAAGLQALVLF